MSELNEEKKFEKFRIKCDELIAEIDRLIQNPPKPEANPMLDGIYSEE